MATFHTLRVVPALAARSHAHVPPGPHRSRPCTAHFFQPRPRSRPPPTLLLGPIRAARRTPRALFLSTSNASPRAPSPRRRPALHGHAPRCAHRVTGRNWNTVHRTPSRRHAVTESLSPGSTSSRARATASHPRRRSSSTTSACECLRRDAYDSARALRDAEC